MRLELHPETLSGHEGGKTKHRGSAVLLSGEVSGSKSSGPATAPLWRPLVVNTTVPRTTRLITVECGRILSVAAGNARAF